MSYRIDYDAGISTSWWGSLDRQPGSPDIPATALAASGVGKQQYGISVYSLIDFVWFMNFWGVYEITY